MGGWCGGRCSPVAVRPSRTQPIKAVFAIFTLALFQSVYNKLIGEIMSIWGKIYQNFSAVATFSSLIRLSSDRWLGLVKN